MRSFALRSLIACSALASCMGAAAKSDNRGAGFVPQFGNSNELDLPGLHYVPGEKLKRTVLDSDETWVLVILENEERCGKPCAEMKQTLSTTATKAGGIFNFAYVNSQDSIIGRDGDMIAAYQEFNITSIPCMIVYGPGPKQVHLGMKMDVQTTGGLLAGGAKMLYQSMRMFMPGMVNPVRAGNIADFLTKPAAHLPRVLLFTDKREVSLTYKKLSMDFEPRAVFGQVVVSDGAGKLAKAFGVDAAAAPVLMVGPAGPVTSALLNATALKTLPEGHFTGFKKFEGKFTYEEMRQWLYAALPQAPVSQVRTKEDFARLCSEAADVSMCFIATLPSEAEAASLERTKEKLDPLDAFRPPTGFEVADDDDDDDDDDEQESRKIRKRQLTFNHLAKVASRSFLRVDWSTMNSDLKAERLPIVFIWLDAEKQKAFDEAFHASAPGFIALNPRRKRFAVMKRSFQPMNLYEFVLDVMETSIPGSRNAISDPSIAHTLRNPQQQITFETLAALPAVVDQPPPARGTSSKKANGKRTASKGAQSKPDKKTEL